jgi:hypothetical protein
MPQEETMKLKSALVGLVAPGAGVCIIAAKLQG